MYYEINGEISVLNSWLNRFKGLVTTDLKVNISKINVGFARF